MRMLRPLDGALSILPDVRAAALEPSPSRAPHNPLGPLRLPPFVAAAIAAQGLPVGPVALQPRTYPLPPATTPYDPRGGWSVGLQLAYKW